MFLKLSAFNQLSIVSLIEVLLSQSANTCSKLTIETRKKGMKSALS